MPLGWTALGLELYALALAAFQALGGVRTDEAKYLLNIPYPHPPLVRWLISQTEWLPFQEAFWRVIFATLLVQAVWIVWDMSRTLPKQERLVLGGGWLLSSGLVLQAGSILMAPLTALQALLFLWLSARRSAVERFPHLVALLWFVALFTAYQALLLLPLVVFLFSTTHLPRARRSAYVLVPVLLLGLYSLAHPLSLASMVVHGSRDLTSGVWERGADTFRLWVLGGSLVMSALGTWGMFRGGWELRPSQPGLVGSFVLVAAYIALSRYDYYMVLFTPLFIGGFLRLLQVGVHPRVLHAVLPLAAVATIVLVFLAPPVLQPGPARAVTQHIAEHAGEGTLLINGPFGHEWQYESHLPVRRFRSTLLSEAAALVCLRSCEGMDEKRWERVEGMPVEVWLPLLPPNPTPQPHPLTPPPNPTP